MNKKTKELIDNEMKRFLTDDKLVWTHTTKLVAVATYQTIINYIDKNLDCRTTDTMRLRFLRTFTQTLRKVKTFLLSRFA